MVGAARTRDPLPHLSDFAASPYACSADLPEPRLVSKIKALYGRVVRSRTYNYLGPAG